jgi:hypothetical protein
MSALSWMRHRDMAIVAVLLLTAAVFLVLFVRSWRGAGATAQPAGGRRLPPPRDHLSKTRALAEDGHGDRGDVEPPA